MHCAFAPEIIQRNIEINLRRGIPAVSEYSAPNGSTVSIMAGGPSLKHTFFNAIGDVWAMNGAHDFLIERRILPKAAVFLDSGAHLVEMFTPRKDVTYYVASQCDPSVFDRLAGHDVVMWHADEDGAARAVPDGSLMISGGSTVALRSINLAYVLGCRDIHLFGLDGSNENGDEHAYSQASSGREMKFKCEGRDFVATPCFAAQGNQLIAMRKLIPDCEITLHGDGLVQHMAATANGGVLG